MPDPTWGEQFAQQQATAGASAIQSGVLGLILGGYNDRRQLKQQRKLQALQIQGSKDLTDYQFQKQLDMWHQTNYGAQMEQLKKAGLNPGLLYGMGGAGGATTGGGGMQTTAATATQAAGGEFGLGIQMGMMAAQKRLIEAQAANLEADTANKPQAGAVMKAQELDLLQGITNKKAQTRLTNLQADLQDIQNEIAGKTKNEAIRIIDLEMLRSEQELDRMVRQNIFDKATMEERQQQITAFLAKTWAEKYLLDAQKTTEQGKPALQMAEIEKLTTEVYQMALKAEQEWRKIELMGGDVETNRQKLNEEIFRTSGLPPQLITDIINLITLKKILTPDAPQRTEVKGLHNRD